jgi:hypothetical protein
MLIPRPILTRAPRRRTWLPTARSDQTSSAARRQQHERDCEQRLADVELRAIAQLIHWR